MKSGSDIIGFIINKYLQYQSAITVNRWCHKINKCAPYLYNQGPSARLYLKCCLCVRYVSLLLIRLSGSGLFYCSSRLNDWGLNDN